MPTVEITEKKPVFAVVRDAFKYNVNAVTVAEMAEQMEPRDAFNYLVGPLLTAEQTTVQGGYRNGLYTSVQHIPVANQTAAWLVETLLRDEDDVLLRPVIVVSKNDLGYSANRMGVEDVFTEHPEGAYDILMGVISQARATSESGEVYLTNDPAILQAQFAVLAPKLSRERVAA